MSGGRVELGLGAGWYEAEHQAYAIPFPSLGERFERLEEQLAIITGCGRPRPASSSTSPGSTTQVTDSPALPEAGPAAAAADHHRRRRPQAHAPTGRHATPTSSTCPSPRSSGSPTADRPGARRRARRSGATRRRWCSRPRWSLCCGARRGRGASGGPRPSAASPTSCARTALAGHAGRGRGHAAALARGGARRASTCRSSTCRDLDHLELIAAGGSSRTCNCVAACPLRFGRRRLASLQCRSTSGVACGGWPGCRAGGRSGVPSWCRPVTETVLGSPMTRRRWAIPCPEAFRAAMRLAEPGWIVAGPGSAASGSVGRLCDRIRHDGSNLLTEPPGIGVEVTVSGARRRKVSRRSLGVGLPRHRLG